MAKKKTEAAKPASTTTIALPGTPTTGLEHERELMQGGNLPFLSLLQAGSDTVKKETIKGCRGGDYALRGQELLDRPLLAIPTVSRPHAIYMPQGDDEGEQQESFDMGDHVFKDIQRKQKSKVQGARYGLQFLLWLPDQGTFAIMGFYNTARTEAAPLVKAREAKKAVELDSRLVEGKSFSWHVPSASIVDLDTLPPMPTPEQQAEAIAGFNAFKAETAAPEPASKRPR